jgi:hypothetical protein
MILSLLGIPEYEAYHLTMPKLYVFLEPPALPTRHTFSYRHTIKQAIAPSKHTKVLPILNQKAPTSFVHKAMDVLRKGLGLKNKLVDKKPNACGF